MSKNINNKLSEEKSPYLLQHEDNPVNWLPWSDAAFEKAEKEDKPVFLSIGYSTCHWCHVMEKESFEDAEVAEYLNDYFISIKVDREERPDIDAVYMKVCQMMTGGGGWPMTIIMSHDKKPFFAGTYYPKRRKGNRVGLMELLPKIAELWQNEREELTESAESIYQKLSEQNESVLGGDPSMHFADAAFDELSKRFDEEFGGFGTSPKFPSPHNLIFLLRYSFYTKSERAEEMALKTLDAMRRGGIFDHIGFGFHRYSTDKHWLLPHFEKMLYDQAMLMFAYSEAYSKTKDEKYISVTDEIFRYLKSNLTSPEGAFYSAEDADSDGVEGKFYVWEMEEIEKVLGEDSTFFADVFNLSKDGNFVDPFGSDDDKLNILNRVKNIEPVLSKYNLTESQCTEKISELREKLFAVREHRVKPFLDKKVTTDWNGLMIAALAYSGAVANNAEYIESAEKAADFIFTNMMKDESTLYHRSYEGSAGIDATLEDYAFMIWAMIELYSATFKNIYLIRAIGFTETVLKHFSDSVYGGFYFTSDLSEEILMRQKEFYDGAIPSSNSVMISNLIRLGKLTGNYDYISEGNQTINSFSEIVSKAPFAFTNYLCGCLYNLQEFLEIVVVAEKSETPTRHALRQLLNVYQPNKTILIKEPYESQKVVELIMPHTRDMKKENDKNTFFVCKNFECISPTNDIDEVLDLINI